MTIQVGDRLPDVPLTIAGADGPQPTTTGEFFGGKRVALFAVPRTMVMAWPRHPPFSPASCCWRCRAWPTRGSSAR